MKAELKTDITTDTMEARSGKLENRFDKDKMQAELDLQRETTQKFDQNRQELKARLYEKVDGKRAEATEIRRNNGGYDTEESKRLDKEATSLDETVRWIDMGMGGAWGLADKNMFWGMFATTQADRVYRSATAPKEMWFQKCSSSNGDCNRDKESRQIWSLNDLTPEERSSIHKNDNLLTISNPGIFNDREGALKNAQKQNISETNKQGIIVVMNPPTGDYKGWKILTSLPSELMYAAYDKLNDKFLSGMLPLNNSQKLNQDLYLQSIQQGYQIDISNHSRGGLTAGVALQNINNWKGVKNIPIRKSRFYGTATNVKDYANQLQKNGYSYTDNNGNTYYSGAYSAVQKADFVGNKWGLGLLGSNDTTGGACWFCYSHSSYFAEVPVEADHDAGKRAEFIKIWGESDSIGNKSAPKLVVPKNNKEEKIDENPY